MFDYVVYDESTYKVFVVFLVLRLFLPFWLKGLRQLVIDHELRMAFATASSTVESVLKLFPFASDVN